MITNRIYRQLHGAPRRQFRRVLLRLPHRKRLVTRFGYQLIVDPSELHGFYLYYEGEYDDHLFRFLLPRLKTYRRAVDLGANIGIYTVFFAQHVPRVDAFEPEPSVIPRLRSNLELNALENVLVHESCIGLRSGNVPFMVADKRNQGTARIIAEQDGVVHRSCVSLDDFFDEPIHESCLLKMDIEGAELLAIQGASRVLANRTAPVGLLIETHPDEIACLGGSLDLLRATLSELGFKVQGITPQGLIPEAACDASRFWWAEG